MNRIEQMIENLVFGNRRVVLAIFAIITALLAVSATNVRFDTNLKKMVPFDHEWIQNLFQYKDDLGLGNDVQIAVARLDGDIFDEKYLDVVRRITEEVMEIQGVDPSNVRSLWTPNVRWSEVTAEGFQGGNVIPDDYDGSAASLEMVRTNVLRSGQVGRVVADNFSSSIVYVPLLEADEQGRGGVDYKTFPQRLEDIRARYQAEDPNLRIHIVGFAKKVGDLIDGIKAVLMFGLVSVLVTFFILWLDFRCVRAVAVIVTASLTAVVWQLGLLNVLGYGLDPYSVLVPFLVFAIGVSHGVQITNAIAGNAVRGDDRLTAARGAFRMLWVPGIVALVSDAIGFGTLYVIDIGVIRELAVAAGIGVALIILTNLILHPTLMSYIGVSTPAVERQRRLKSGPSTVWKALSAAASARIALPSIAAAAVLYVGGAWLASGALIGDLDKGAPELWPDPCAERECAPGEDVGKRYRYNHDVSFITGNYSVSADVLVVMAKTPENGCNAYEALTRIDDLQWLLQNTEGVQSSISLATVTRSITAALNEGNYRWYELSRDQNVLNNALRTVPTPTTLFNGDCTLTPLFVFLHDHKAETLERVTGVVEKFAAARDEEGVVRFLLASGSAGIEAATNQAIERANFTMLMFVYAVVIVLVWLAFRSWRAVVCIIVPLGLTSVLCQALMAGLDIGVKVATLPVIALGVGIGVDYGIYIYSRLREFLDQGMALQDAYFETLKTTGKAVWFTGITLAIGVVTWAFSPIKFQADMGILLTFMFLWNMIGALWLLPALAHLLLKPREIT
jgi:predicted RND superfamily exporter protein